LGTGAFGSSEQKAGEPPKTASQDEQILLAELIEKVVRLQIARLQAVAELKNLLLGDGVVAGGVQSTEQMEDSRLWASGKIFREILYLGLFAVCN
jgi:hypothetical protein